MRIRTVEQLNELPPSTVVRSDSTGLIFVVEQIPGGPRVWLSPMSVEFYGPEDIILPASILVEEPITPLLPADQVWDEVANAYPQMTRDMVSRSSVRQWILDHNPYRSSDG